jgi:hypothetical protein
VNQRFQQDPHPLVVPVASDEQGHERFAIDAESVPDAASGAAVGPEAVEVDAVRRQDDARAGIRTPKLGHNPSRDSTEYPCPRSAVRPAFCREAERGRKTGVHPTQQRAPVVPAAPDGGTETRVAKVDGSEIDTVRHDRAACMDEIAGPARPPEPQSREHVEEKEPDRGGPKRDSDAPPVDEPSEIGREFARDHFEVEVPSCTSNQFREDALHTTLIVSRMQHEHNSLPVAIAHPGLPREGLQVNVLPPER